MTNINISHNDLDGASSALLIKHKYQDTSSINISYSDIKETLRYYEDTIVRDHSISTVWITDLNFSTDELVQLFKIVKKFPHVKFIYIDHHDYSDKSKFVLNKINDLENGTSIVRTDKCATKLVHEYLGLTDINIKLYVEVVNAFDIWLVDSKFHDLGVDLNNYFWNIKIRRFNHDFKDFNLKNKTFIHKAKSIRESANKHFLNLENNGLNIVQDDIRLLFTDEYLGMVNSIYNEKYIVICTSRGTMSIRLSTKIPKEEAIEIKNSVVKNVENSQYFVSGGGHPHAFGLTFSEEVSNNSDLIIDLARSTVNAIAKFI